MSEDARANIRLLQAADLPRVFELRTATLENAITREQLEAYGFYQHFGWRPTGKMDGDDEVFVRSVDPVTG